VPGSPVADGIGRVPGFVNSYVVRDGESTVLVDTGFRARAKPIVRAFAASGVPLDRVGQVLLTHYHVDHIGGAAFLLENSHARAACHGLDAPFVDGRQRQPLPLLMRLFVRVHPAPVATVLNDGDRIGALTVIHAPGHTPGEVAFFDPARKILFSGDSVVERKGRLTLPAARVATDLRAAVRSLDRLRALGAELLLPGHGVPVGRGLDALFEDLIRRAPVEFLRRAGP
jgi:glyoxylase-like metal-dependent hydrolase (beta-lactamase superfamily II)